MKRRAFAPLLLALCLLVAPCALAQGTTYVFPYEGLRYTQDDGETVLTQTNLAQHEALIASLGTTGDAILASYIASGIVMEVLPDDGGQIAVSVADAGAFSDVTRMSQLDDARLAQFAAQFSESGLYETCELKNTDPICVRLTSSAMYGSMPVYTLRYATLHLGRLYMLTMTVVGRSPEEADDAALERVLSRMELLNSLSSPSATPVPASTPAPTATPMPTPGEAAVIAGTGELTVEGVPAYTQSSALTVSGTAEANSVVRVSAGERSLGQTTSGPTGAFSINVTLPETGDIELKVEAGDAQQTLALRYELPYAALQITAPEETTFTGTNVIVRGVTEPNATVYVNGKGINTNVQANRNGEFSARIFLYGAETQTFTLRTKLRGFQESTAEITLTRVLTEREAIAEFRQQIVNVTFDQLAAHPEDYQGKKFILRGRVADFADYDGTPCALILVSNVSTGIWRDPVWVVLTGEETVSVDDILSFYLEGEGTTLPADGQYTRSGERIEAPVARAAFISENR